MFAKLASLSSRRCKLVLAVAGLIAAGAGSLAIGTADRLVQGGFENPAAESAVARDYLADEFASGPPNVILVVTPTDGTIDDGEVAAQGQALTQRLRDEPGVASADSYWTLNSSASLASQDETQALVFARIEGSESEVQDVMEELAPRYDGATIDNLEVRLGGEAEVFRQVQHRIESDLLLAEAVAIPLTLIALIFVFRSLVAALLPLAIGLVSVVSTLGFLRILTEIVPVSIFSLNITTALGLGLAIDYSLFILSRYREAIANGDDAHQAVITSLATAGRTVAFSATVVTLSLSAMLVFPQYVLRSFAYAGIGVTVFAALGALILMPALLTALGPRRVNALDLRRPFARLLGRPRTTHRATEKQLWARIARSVMRRPVLVATTIVAVLVVLGSPFLRAEFAQPDDRVLPPNEPASAVHSLLRSEFPDADLATISVLARDVDPGARRADTSAYASALSRVAGVDRVQAATGVFIAGSRSSSVPPRTAASQTTEDSTYLIVVTSVEPLSSEGKSLVSDIRAVPAPYEVQVAGDSAELADTLASLEERLPWAVGIIAVATLIILFLFTGSVLLPIKAVVLNLLSLSAAFGAMVFIFQDGHLQWLVGDFTPTGALDVTSPILMFCLLFGLSMDYEVFLLSRIKEEWDATGDNQMAVQYGLQRTGGLITAAALLLVIIFLGVATSGIPFIKMLGVGTALAIAVDATLIRGALVPAFMQIAGKANWWAPAALRRLHNRIGVSEGVVRPADPITSTHDAAI